MAEPDTLRGWIRASRQTQRRIVIAAGVVTGAGLALRPWLPFIGLLVAFAGVVIGVCGWWVTTAHISDWRGQLAHHAARRAGAAASAPSTSPSTPPSDPSSPPAST